MNSTAPLDAAQPSDWADLSDQELFERHEAGEITLAQMSDAAAARLIAYTEVKYDSPPADDDLIPDLEPVAFERSEMDRQLDAVMDGMSILDAYQRWCPKPLPENKTRKRESVMVRCPNPAHPDNNPSAWVNLDKDVWVCGGCGFQGGDKYDLAAWHYGYNVPEYKRDGSFPQLRRDIASEFGIEDVRGASGRSVGGEVLTELPDVPAAPSEKTPPTEPAETDKDGESDGTLLVLPGADEFEEPEFYGALDWEPLVEPNSFLETWMRAVTVDDFPHEFRFFMGLQALGFAAGNRVLLADNPPVKGNLFVCLFGGTGSNKSRSIHVFQKLLDEVFPLHPGDEYTHPSGIEIMGEPGSGEVLVDCFAHPLQDSSTNAVIGHAPVSGLLKIEEFSSFVAKAGRSGSSLKPVLIEMYDVARRQVTIKSRGAGTSIAEQPFCQAITTTQPAAIHSYLDRTDATSGFLNRWLFITGQPRIEKINYMTTIPDITDAIASLKDVSSWANKGRREMLLSGDALELWDDFCRVKLNPLMQRADNPLLNRVELTLKKAILLFAVNGKRSAPSADDVGRAIGLFDYLIETFSFVAGSLVRTDYDDCADDILAAVARLVSRKQIPTLRNINRSLRRQHDRFVVEKTIKNMVAVGELTERLFQSSKGGRASVVFLADEEEFEVPDGAWVKSVKRS